MAQTQVYIKNHPKEYHVSVVSGDDKNEGTLFNPFKTISEAARVAMPGDVITVHGGIYHPFPGPIEVRNAGTQEWKVWPK